MKTPSHLLLAIAALCLGVGLFSLSLANARAAETPRGTSERADLPILQTLAVKDGNYRQRSYLVEWKGTEVVAEDRLRRVLHYTDRLLPVRVYKSPYPKDQKPYGLMHISVEVGKKQDAKPSDNEGPFEKAPTIPPQVFDLPVKRVIAVQEDGCLHRSYTVMWKGQEAFARDVLVQTTYNVGDIIPVLVMHLAHPDPLVAEGTLSMNVQTPRRRSPAVSETVGIVRPERSILQKILPGRPKPPPPLVFPRQPSAEEESRE
ncbi:MAG: hypothetical protein V4773_22740 [Verrucomicrobiota bacterium]